MGKHFAVNFSNNPSQKRLYSTVLSYTKQNIQIRHRYFSKNIKNTKNYKFILNIIRNRRAIMEKGSQYSERN